MNLRRLFNVVFVTLFCHGPFVCAVAESIDAASLHTDTSDDEDLTLQNQRLRSENEKLQDSVSKLVKRAVDQYLLIKDLESQLEELVRSRAEDEELKTEKTGSISSWWGIGPFPRWINEEEEMQVISEECHTLGCCLSTMLQLWLLILRQIWSMTLILCSDPLSWIGSRWQNVTAIIPIVTEILDVLLLFLMLNLIAYVLLKLRALWVRVKSFVLPIFKLPVFVVFWSLSCFAFNLLKKSAAKNKERSQVSKSQMTKLKKELKELKGTVDDLRKHQVDNSMTNEFQALKTQLQQLTFDNRPALPAPENQNTIEYEGHTLETEYPLGDFNNVEDIRGSGRNGSYRVTQNLRRRMWMSFEDEFRHEY